MKKELTYAILALGLAGCSTTQQGTQVFNPQRPTVQLQNVVGTNTFLGKTQFNPYDVALGKSPAILLPQNTNYARVQLPMPYNKQTQTPHAELYGGLISSPNARTFELSINSAVENIVYSISPGYDLSVHVGTRHGKFPDKKTSVQFTFTPTPNSNHVDHMASFTTGDKTGPAGVSAQIGLNAISGFPFGGPLGAGIAGGTTAIAELVPDGKKPRFTLEELTGINPMIPLNYALNNNSTYVAVPLMSGTNYVGSAFVGFPSNFLGDELIEQTTPLYNGIRISIPAKKLDFFTPLFILGASAAEHINHSKSSQNNAPAGINGGQVGAPGAGKNSQIKGGQ